MNYAWNCNRIQLADILSARALPSETELIKIGADFSISEHTNELVVIWNLTQTEDFVLPVCIILQEYEILNFTAWMSTYFRHLRPFTSQCRIINRDDAIRFFRYERSEILSLRGATTGLVIGEVIAHSFGRRDLRKISYLACCGTLSFSIAQLANKKDFLFDKEWEAVDSLIESWTLTRAIGGRDAVRLTPESIAKIWHIVIQAHKEEWPNSESQDSALRHIVSKAYNNQPIGPKDFSKEFSQRLNLDRVWEMLNGPRERRVSAIREALQLLSPKLESESDGFSCLAGFLVSRIDPGSLEHFEVLTDVSERFPQSFLWYAVFAGLTKSNTVSDYLDGLGRLIQRQIEVHHSLFERPSADISIQELAVISGGAEMKKAGFRTRSLSTVEVELLPTVVTVLTWIGSESELKAAELTQEKNQPDLFGNDSALSPLDPSLQDELDLCRRQLNEISSRLGQIVKLNSKRKRGR